MKRKLIKMYHASIDLNIGKKRFKPMIPANRCKGENDTIKRICVAKTVKDALSSFPYKNKYANKPWLWRYITVYEIEVPVEDVIFSEDLTKYVPDAHITNECWITKECEGYGKIYEVFNFKLEKYNYYCKEQLGRVKSFDLIELPSKYEDSVKVIVVGKELQNKICTTLTNNNISYKIEKAGANKFYKTDMDGYFIGTTEQKYEWIELKININHNDDILKAYQLIQEANMVLDAIDGNYIRAGLYGVAPEKSKQVLSYFTFGNKDIIDLIINNCSDIDINGFDSINSLNNYDCIDILHSMFKCFAPYTEKEFKYQEEYKNCLKNIRLDIYNQSSLYNFNDISNIDEVFEYLREKFFNLNI